VGVGVGTGVGVGVGVGATVGLGVAGALVGLAEPQAEIRIALPSTTRSRRRTKRSLLGESGNSVMSQRTMLAVAAILCPLAKYRWIIAGKPGLGRLWTPAGARSADRVARLGLVSYPFAVGRAS
jgi:hypothetical protein